MPMMARQYDRGYVICRHYCCHYRQIMEQHRQQQQKQHPPSPKQAIQVRTGNFNGPSPPQWRKSHLSHCCFNVNHDKAWKMRVFILKLIAVILTINLSFSHKTAVKSNSSRARIETVTEATTITFIESREIESEATTVSKAIMSERINPIIREYSKREASDDETGDVDYYASFVKLLRREKRKEEDDDDEVREQEETIKKLFQLGLLDERSNKSLTNSLKFEGNRKIKYDLNVYTNLQIRDKMRTFNMSKLFEEGSQKDPISRIIILKNDTTLFVIHKFNKYYYWEHGQTAAAIIIFTMIVVGNISILHRLKSCRRRRSNVNYFIVQLAIADLFVGLFSVTLDTALRFQKAFTYGLLACRASKYIQVSTGKEREMYSELKMCVCARIERKAASYCECINQADGSIKGSQGKRALNK